VHCKHRENLTPKHAKRLVCKCILLPSLLQDCKVHLKHLDGCLADSLHGNVTWVETSSCVRDAVTVLFSELTCEKVFQEATGGSAAALD
jgi:hypothetical protein